MPAVTPKVEFRTCISATERFLRMLRYQLESLRTFAGPLARSAHWVVVVSRDTPLRDLHVECPWTAEHSVQFVWMDEQTFERWTYDGTGFVRFDRESDADIVVLCDADLLFAGDFDETLTRSHREQVHLGQITHVSPFEQRSPFSRRWLRNRRGWLRTVLGWNASSRWWQAIYREAGLGPPELSRQHSAWGLLSRDPRHRYCPDHFNYGFLVAPRQFVDAIGETFVRELEAVDRVVESGYKSQIAHTLALDRHRIPCDLLSLNDNFPLNMPERDFRALNPDPQGADSPEDIRVFHYLGDGAIGQRNFTTAETVEQLLDRELADPSARAFQARLQEVHRRIVM